MRTAGPLTSLARARPRGLAQTICSQGPAVYRPGSIEADGYLAAGSQKGSHEPLFDDRTMRLAGLLKYRYRDSNPGYRRERAAS